MSRPPGRKLSPEEAALWARIAQSVTPIEGRARPPVVPKPAEASPPPVISPPKAPPVGSAPSPRKPAPLPPVRASEDVKAGLDASWDRKLARGGAQPDFALDLHGASLDGAYSRLLHGLTQARAMGARVVLVVTGKPRPADAADRANRRGAIRAKIVDWLAASEHASAIAAIRGAHRRHGGEGALYIVLKRKR